VRTVEGHLTHAYGKLAIRTRRELEQALANEQQLEGGKRES
jgi:DNA-binding CsgD family transcriptional regulator